MNKLQRYVLSGRFLSNPFGLALVLVLGGFLLMVVGPFAVLTDALGRKTGQLVGNYILGCEKNRAPFEAPAQGEGR